MADSNKLQLTIITPERVFYEKEVDRVIFKTTEGDIGVLKGHIPLTVSLSSGPCLINIGNEEYTGVIHGGFAKINEKGVSLLVNAAEWPKEIDPERAKRKLEEAKRLLAEVENEAMEVKLKYKILKQSNRIRASELLKK